VESFAVARDGFVSLFPIVFEYFNTLEKGILLEQTLNKNKKNQKFCNAGNWQKWKWNS